MAAGERCGYGFIAKLEDLHTRQRAGKAVLNLTDNAKVLCPVPLAGDDAVIAAVNDEGRLLVFPASEQPEMARGKGNKIFGIPTRRAEAREELLVALATLREGQKLVVRCGDRSMTLTWKELEPHRGLRAQRGAFLSRNTTARWMASKQSDAGYLPSTLSLRVLGGIVEFLAGLFSRSLVFAGHEARAQQAADHQYPRKICSCACDSPEFPCWIRMIQ